MSIKFGAFNPLIPPLVSHVNDKINVVVFGDEFKNDVKDIAENSKFKSKYTFWHSSGKDRLGNVVVQNVSGSLDKMNIAIFDGEFQKKYFMKVKSKDELTKMITEHDNGTLKPFLKSAERPKNDADPDHEGVTVVVQKSFEELVINSDKDVFLDVWAPWCGPCVACGPAIARLGKVLKDNDNVIIAKLNSDQNDIDPKYFSVRSIPLFMFYPKGKKDAPLKYQGKRNTSDFLKFIATNGGSKINVDKLLPDILKAEELEAVKRQVASAVGKVLKDYNHFQNDLDKFKSVKELASKLSALAKDSKDSDEIKKSLKEFNGKITDFNAAVTKLYKAEEIKKLKNVKKVHSYEEYQKFLKEAGDKLVVVDFTATWCGPCRYIAPHFANFSEKYPGVVFLKVDVDQVPKAPRSAVPPVTCYPTFHFMKSGKFVKKMEGASPDGLEKLVKELK